MEIPITTVKELIASYEHDVDESNILQTDGFRTGFLFFLHSKSLKKKVYVKTLDNLIAIATTNNILNVNRPLLKTHFSQLIRKMDSFRNRTRDFLKIKAFLDSSLTLPFVAASNILSTIVTVQTEIPVVVPVESQTSEEPPLQKLKTDCIKCSKRRLQIKKMSQSNIQATKKIKSLKEMHSQLSPVSIKRLRQALSRKSAIEVRLRSAISLLKRKLAATESKLDTLKNFNKQKEISKLRRTNAKMRSNHIQFRLTKNKDMKTLRLAKLETEKTLAQLQIDNHYLLSQIEELNTGTPQDLTIETKADEKTYSVNYRKAAYHCLTNQVPVESISHVMSMIVEELTGHTLKSVCDQSTSSQFAYELGILSDLQVGEAMVENPNMTIAWDSTSLDGTHVNEVHINIAEDRPRGLILQVGNLAGGTTVDYTDHIKSSIDEVVTTYATYHNKDIVTTKRKCIDNIKNTISDRAAVNHCVVQQLSQDLDLSLLELKCNVHPLDGLAGKCRSVLKELDQAVESRSATFGSDCMVVNFILGMSKMRFKQGKGDPAGFKHFMRQNNIKAGQIIRYVGNRLHVIFHLSGIFYSLQEKLLQYLKHHCNNTSSLRTALIKDLQNNSIIIQLRCLGLLGKVLTGPWMRIFYGNEKQLTNLEIVPHLKTCMTSLKNMANNPEQLLTTEKDIFDMNLTCQDEVLVKLQDDVFKNNKEEFCKTITSLLNGAIVVFERQMHAYLEGELASPTTTMLQQTKSAPVHNIFAEQTLGLTDHQWRRAPNATIGFIDGKVKAKKNATLAWLKKKPELAQSSMVMFAVKRAAKVRNMRRQRELTIQKLIQKRQQEKDKKKERLQQNKIEKQLKQVLNSESTIDTEFPDILPSLKHVLQNIVTDVYFLQNMYFSHTWEVDENDVVFRGLVRRLKSNARTRSNTWTLTISYWRQHESIDDSSDSTLPLSQFLADLYSGYLELDT